MRAIHPFPARMAPETIDELIAGLPASASVLDPMCGSGVVVRQAAKRGLAAAGYDVDPLAVLMSRVWSRSRSVRRSLVVAQDVVERACRTRLGAIDLPWIDECPETKRFVRYWFADSQRRQLRRLSHVVAGGSSDIPAHIRDCLWLALSRIIITKHAGASLAWDVPHSRPHKMRETNDFDVFSMFIRSVAKLAEILEEEPLARSARVRRGDCRDLSTVTAQTFDAVITSPPYLNAIDYLRGHKLSLVWMGHSIPSLRRVRAASIGTEAARMTNAHGPADYDHALQCVPNVLRVPLRQQNIIRRYASDASIFLREMHRIMKPGGRLALVLGDSNIRGQHIENSKLFAALAHQAGFAKTSQRRRALEENRRYLPVTSRNNSLENRMRYEVIQTYVAA